MAILLPGPVEHGGGRGGEHCGQTALQDPSCEAKSRWRAVPEENPNFSFLFFFLFFWSDCHAIDLCWWEAELSRDKSSQWYLLATHKRCNFRTALLLALALKKIIFAFLAKAFTFQACNLVSGNRHALTSLASFHAIDAHSKLNLDCCCSRSFGQKLCWPSPSVAASKIRGFRKSRGWRRNYNQSVYFFKANVLARRNLHPCEQTHTHTHTSHAQTLQMEWTESWVDMPPALALFHFHPPLPNLFLKSFFNREKASV